MVIHVMEIGLIGDGDILRSGDQLSHTGSIEAKVAHIASRFI